LHRRSIARRAAAPERTSALFRELGRPIRRLQQPFEAIDAWRKLLEVARDFEAIEQPRDPAAGPRSAGRRSSRSRWPRRVPSDPAREVREWLEVASLWEQRVGEADKGTPAYEKILRSTKPTTRRSSPSRSCTRHRKRGEPLIELYLARLETRDDVHERTLILRKVAKVFEEQLEDKSARRSTRS
jgi:hypothetical protein